MLLLKVTFLSNGDFLVVCCISSLMKSYVVWETNTNLLSDNLKMDYKTLWTTKMGYQLWHHYWQEWTWMEMGLWTVIIHILGLCLTEENKNKTWWRVNNDRISLGCGELFNRLRLWRLERGGPYRQGQTWQKKKTLSWNTANKWDLTHKRHWWPINSALACFQTEAALLLIHG